MGLHLVTCQSFRNPGLFAKLGASGQYRSVERAFTHCPKCMVRSKL